MLLQLHLATPADSPKIQELAAKIWWAHYPEIISDEQIEYMLEMMYAVPVLQKQMADGQVFRMVILENQAIGYIATTKMGDGKYFLNKFYIEKTEQGRGIGQAVFEMVLAEIPDWSEMRLVVNRRNFRSVNFYFKMGFIIEKLVDTPFGPNYVMDDFQMLLKK